MTHVAIIAQHVNNDIKRAIAVPDGQSLDFDKGTTSRAWLWPYLGSEWHLVEFLEVTHPRDLGQPPR